MSSMEINIAQVIFQIINFGVVFAALTYFLTGPIMKILDDRRKQTEEASKAAEEALRERDSVEAMKKKAKTQAERDADKVMEDAKADAKELKAKLTKEVKDEVSALRAKELEKVESEKKARMEEMEKQVAKLSVAIASKVIGEEVDEKKHKSLISASLKDLAKAI